MQDERGYIGMLEEKGEGSGEDDWEFAALVDGGESLMIFEDLAEVIDAKAKDGDEELLGGENAEDVVAE
jgi:hypothetical protein